MIDLLLRRPDESYYKKTDTHFIRIYLRFAGTEDWSTFRYEDVGTAEKDLGIILDAISGGLREETRTEVNEYDATHYFI